MTARSLGAAALTLALAGCGGAADAREPGAAKKPTALQVGHARSCTPGLRRLGSARVAYAGVAQRPLRAYRRPGRTPVARFGLKNVNGVPTVFGVLGAVVGRSCRATWYRVQLPMRPNGAAGYVRARNVWVTKVRTRIEVDVSARRLTFFRRGRPVVRARVAVGAHATPTPIGRFYVNQRLIPADIRGPFGPGAIGISAFSTVLTGWTQGGPVAIHGTNEPWSIGHAVSNGCIRLPNPVLRRVFRATLAGTPVVVHP
jgi:lipoprotein-anchoring transpeptidase ErfK/SrfK